MSYAQDFSLCCVSLSHNRYRSLLLMTLVAYQEYYFVIAVVYLVVCVLVVHSTCIRHYVVNACVLLCYSGINAFISDREA